MKEVTFSGRWLYKAGARNRRSKQSRGPKILSVFGAAGLIAILLLSTAFAATGAKPQVQSPEPGAQSPEDAVTTEPGPNGETDPAWIEHIRSLKVEQQRVQQALAEQRQREEQERLKAREQPQPANLAMLTPEEEKEAQVIDFYLSERGSPMTGCGRIFVKASKMRGVDPALIVAIAGKESSWGKYCFLPYNAWGWGSSAWSSWDEAINCVTFNIKREYISKGLDTPHKMAHIYCPPSNGSWEQDVTTSLCELTALFSQYR